MVTQTERRLRVEKRHHPDRPMARRGCRGLYILVVEDCADCAELMALLLRCDGHEVAVVSNGAAALEAVRVSAPDVMLLDIHLPGTMDGWELARRIKRQPAPKTPLLIALTGLGHKEDQRRSAEAGIDLHLVKPVEPQFLRGLLARFQQVLEPAAPERTEEPTDQGQGRPLLEAVLP